ncbi:LysM repeat protein [Paenibacillus phyllosphaerae]|uniref:LysM repeat protein n=1 Tax=Paenibacillus phyllosphaerae TaxID=274593 RepID=A0A7W5FMK6_9BACL|nr:LysM peptidoglycan-binding domain-containing protein [Paenibacillus phyllosphaerae]MBB3110366.1 LysM repeat protein [Paenibacillus phyllosphaerae]
MITAISSYSYNGQAKANNKQTNRRKEKRKSLIKVTVRLIAAAIFFIIVFAGFTLMKGDASMSHPAQPTADERLIVVGSGDTLWEIAGKVKQDGDDIREVVYNIKKRNQLENSALNAGQSLIIPAGE